MKTKIPKGKTLYAVKYRIYPDDSQANFFMRTFGCCRKYWNLALEDRNKQYEIKRSLPEDEQKAFEIKTKTPAYFKKDYPNCKDEVPNYRGFYDNSFTNKKHIKNK